MRIVVFGVGVVRMESEFQRGEGCLFGKIGGVGGFDEFVRPDWPRIISRQGHRWEPRQHSGECRIGCHGWGRARQGLISQA